MRWCAVVLTLLVGFGCCELKSQELKIAQLGECPLESHEVINDCQSVVRSIVDSMYALEQTHHDNYGCFAAQAAGVISAMR